MDLYPIKMTPTFKDYLWGGEKLKKEYNKPTPYQRTAESWEVAVHKNGYSVAQNGEMKGKNVSEIYDIWKERLFGRLNKSKTFPLMLKLIDARDNLSVQVHPTDEYAKKNENGQHGKTEMWYILEADENAELIYGFSKDITKEEFKKAINENNLRKILNSVKVQSGDCFLINSGTVHAIGKGILLAEIQQNSDLTYRVYDYGRIGADGHPRPLHINKALDVSVLASSKGKEKVVPLNFETANCKKTYLCANKYFTSEKIIAKNIYNDSPDGDSFWIIMFLNGGDINGINAKRGESFLIPAELSHLSISKGSEFLKFYVSNLNKLTAELCRVGFNTKQINNFIK